MGCKRCVHKDCKGNRLFKKIIPSRGMIVYSAKTPSGKNLTNERLLSRMVKKYRGY